MASYGCISAAANIPFMASNKDSRWVGFGFRGSELAGRDLRIPLAKSSRARKEARQFKVWVLDLVNRLSEVLDFVCLFFCGVIWD